MPRTNLKTIKLSNIWKFNRSGSRTFMTSKKELNVVVSNGYQPVNESLMSKSPGLTSDKILLLSDESLLKGEDKKNTIHKSGSSNLLVDKTKSIVKLILSVFSFALKVVLPNIKICVSENRYYLTADSLCWLNCSGVCDVHPIRQCYSFKRKISSKFRKKILYIHVWT